KTSVSAEADVDSSSTLEAQEPSEKSTPASDDNSYPKITQDNVVAFLTAYGKEHPENKVKISTRLGDIVISLYEDTPLHRANFIYLVKQNYFENTFFHRVVPDFIIQGGNSDLASTNKKRAEIGPSYLLPAEINGRNHSYGSVSGAKEYRENPDKQTAPFEFFIFLGPQSSTSHLNGNYTVFGKVIEGMDVVEKISELDRDEGEWPVQNVYISAEIVE
ncbi:MAG: peptidylprolyl isomerase, partial [Marinirhabdus sp.]|nr:peptidylprolyl isomerase [Marinirhabdus sp.]